MKSITRTFQLVACFTLMTLFLLEAALLPIRRKRAPRILPLGRPGSE